MWVMVNENYRHLHHPRPLSRRRLPVGGDVVRAGAWRADEALTWISGVILGTCFIVCVCGVRGVCREETSDE